MWEFLDNVLERAGVVAALFTLVMISAGSAVVALWKQNQRLHADLREALQAASAKTDDNAKVHTTELKALADEHARRIKGLAERIDDLQERRVREAGSLTERVMEHIKHIDQFAAKLEATIDVVLQANRHR